MALAGYLAEHPELRLGQAVINTLHDGPCPEVFYVRDADAAKRIVDNHWRVPL